MISTSFLIAMSVHCQMPREENKFIEEVHDWWIIWNPSTMYLKMLAWLFCNQSLCTQDREKKKLGPRGSVYLGVSVLRIESQFLWSSIGTSDGKCAGNKDSTFHEHAIQVSLTLSGVGRVCRWKLKHGRFISAVMNVKMFMLQKCSIQQNYFIIFFKKWVAMGCLDRQQAQSLFYFLTLIEKLYDDLLLPVLFLSVLVLTPPPFFQIVPPPLNWSGNFVCI